MDLDAITVWRIQLKMAFEFEAGGSFTPSSDDLPTYLKAFSRMGNHVARYQLAKACLRQDRVLDVGCGYGAGACIMSPAFAEYVGIDPDEVAIDWARRVVAPRFPHTVFLTKEEYENQRLPHDFGVSIAFEVIEHVHDPRALLQFLLTSTRNGGLVLLSTPNGASSLHQRSLFRSPFHIDEFEISQIDTLVSISGYPAQYFKQRRLDWLDVMVLRRHRRAAITSRRPERGRSFPIRAFSQFVEKNLNGRFFWRLIPSTPSEMRELDYSTILVKITATDAGEGLSGPDQSI
jgi:SAM-dependent methyltransferase